MRGNRNRVRVTVADILLLICMISWVYTVVNIIIKGW